MFDNGFEIHNVKMGDPHGKLAKGGKTVKVRWVWGVGLACVGAAGRLSGGKAVTVGRWVGGQG